MEDAYKTELMLEKVSENLSNHLKDKVFELKPKDCSETKDEIKIRIGPPALDSELNMKSMATVTLLNYDEPMFIAEIQKVEDDEFAVVDDHEEILQARVIPLQGLDSGKTALFKSISKRNNQLLLYPSDMKITIEPRSSIHLENPVALAEFEKSLIKIEGYLDFEIKVYIKREYLAESILTSQVNLRTSSRHLDNPGLSARNRGILSGVQERSSLFVAPRSSILQDMYNKMNEDSALLGGCPGNTDLSGLPETLTENFISNVVCQGVFKKKKIGKYNLERVVFGEKFSMIEVNPIEHSVAQFGGFMDSTIPTGQDMMPNSMIAEDIKEDDAEIELFHSCEGGNFNGYIERRLNLENIRELFDSEDQPTVSATEEFFTVTITKGSDTNFDRPIREILDDLM